MQGFPITDIKRISEWSQSAAKRLSDRFALDNDITDYHQNQIYSIIINHLLDRGAYIDKSVVYLDKTLIGHISPINKDIIIYSILVNLYYPISPNNFDDGLDDIGYQSSMIFYNRINDYDMDWIEYNVIPSIKRIEDHMLTAYLWLVPSGKYDQKFIRQEVKLFNQHYPEMAYDDLQFVSDLLNEVSKNQGLGYRKIPLREDAKYMQRMEGYPGDNTYDNFI